MYSRLVQCSYIVDWVSKLYLHVSPSSKIELVGNVTQTITTITCFVTRLLCQTFQFDMQFYVDSETDLFQQM